MLRVVPQATPTVKIISPSFILPFSIHNRWLNRRWLNSRESWPLTRGYHWHRDWSPGRGGSDAALVYLCTAERLEGMMAFPPVQLPARLSAMLGKGETSPCLWAWICSSSFLNPCFSALIPMASPSLVFGLPIPDSLLDMVIPIPIWFRGDRSNFVPRSSI